jgi:mono/diheme cytochrome c family protein
MNKYTILGLIAMLVIVTALPLYALQEPARMAATKNALRAQQAQEAANLYVEDCAFCHGPSGQGIGAMPPLDNPGLAQADIDALYRVIARSSHGSNMAAWHVDEGGVLNTYEVQGLVALIHEADWDFVDKVATSRAFTFVEPVIPDVDLTTLEGVGESPHECQACHEEPAVHADRFGLNCARCHGLEAWKPALLTRHTFELDHGGAGKLACDTCHTVTYSEHTCYGCHDHTPEQMETVHAKQDIVDITTCVQCHPTGQEGEGNQMRASLTPPAPRDGYRVGDQH